MKILKFALLNLKKAIIILIFTIALVVSALYFSNAGGWWNSTTTTSSTSTSTQTWTSTTSTSTPPLTTPPNATVFGLVSTIGNGTQDTEVIFTSSTGDTYIAPVTDGHFSIQLPNPGTYNVTTKWKGLYPWQNGTNFKGQAILNWGPGSKATQSFNIEEETPESLIKVSGAITLKGSVANPILVRFIMTDGQILEAAVKYTIYSIDLPNMMTYTISVMWEDADSNTGWSNADPVTIQASPGIKGQSLNLWPI